MKKSLLFLIALMCMSSASAFTIDEIVGQYTGSMNCRQYCVFESDESSWTTYTAGDFTMTITKGENENEVIINNIFVFKDNEQEANPVTATFDPSTNQLLIEPQLIALNYIISNSSAIEQDSDGYDVVTNPQPVYATFDTEKNLTLADWCMSVNESTWDVYVTNGEAAYVPASVGISDITADIDNTDAPVELFNLQGARINNGTAPAPGLYIRRQGSKVQKVIVH